MAPRMETWTPAYYQFYFKKARCSTVYHVLLQFLSLLYIQSSSLVKSQNTFVDALLTRFGVSKSRWSPKGDFVFQLWVYNTATLLNVVLFVFSVPSPSSRRWRRKNKTCRIRIVDREIHVVRSSLYCCWAIRQRDKTRRRIFLKCVYASWCRLTNFPRLFWYRTEWNAAGIDVRLPCMVHRSPHSGEWQDRWCARARDQVCHWTGKRTRHVLIIVSALILPWSADILAFPLDAHVLCSRFVLADAPLLKKKHVSDWTTLWLASSLLLLLWLDSMGDWLFASSLLFRLSCHWDCVWSIVVTNSSYMPVVWFPCSQSCVDCCMPNRCIITSPFQKGRFYQIKDWEFV